MKLSCKGLSESEVLESRAKHGANVLTPPPRKPLWKQFLETFNDPLIKILLVALALSLVVSAYEYFYIDDKGFEVVLEPIGIACAILLATLVGFLVEVNANKKFDVLNKINDDVLVKVMRDGAVTQVQRRDVVVGDVVIVDTGDKVPADGELIDSMSLSVNESSFTGESINRKKSHRADFNDADATYASNVLLRGSNVGEGHGVMRVTRVGDATEYGKIYTNAQIEHDMETPLMKQFNKLGKYISWFSYVAAVLIVAGRLLAFFIDYGADFDVFHLVEYSIETLMLAVTLIVVSVPEGLPMAVTLSLALSMRRMLLSNNLVRKMHACETMGATTVICTDKTGTLTRNQMLVHNTHFPDLGEAQRLNGSEASVIIAHNLACNATAHLDLEKADKDKTIGNPTEGALLMWLHSQGVDYAQLRKNATVEAQLPFSTENKYMATVLTSDALGGKRVLLVKGASEIIKRYCSSVAQDVAYDTISAELLDYQNKAMRTLGFAYKVLADADPCPVSEGRLDVEGMTFLGIVAISDPVRDDVPDAIRQCAKAGIKVKIVTGDTPGTAREIGRQVGLWAETDGPEALILGEEFAALPDDEAAKRAQQIKIMSRARPADKARLVALLQRENEVVAVTGDGTNDAPALNKAQVGLSMGDGTAVAKEASDITIIDNSFASINKAVMWGRSLYKNILRFIIFQLVVNVAACLLVGVGSFFTDKHAVLTVTQMLWVNLIMDTFAALALASLPPSENVMNDKPRGNSVKIFSSGMKWFVAGWGLLFFGIMMGLFYSLLDEGVIDMKERTVFFTTFVALQFWNIFNAKSFASGHSAFHNMKESKIFFAVALVIFLGQFLIVEFGGKMFQVVPLRIDEFLPVFLYTMPVMLVGQVRYLFKNRLI